MKKEEHITNTINFYRLWIIIDFSIPNIRANYKVFRSLLLLIPIINNLRPKNLDSRFLGQCIALVSRKKQLLSYVLLCNHRVAHRKHMHTYSDMPII